MTLASPLKTVMGRNGSIVRTGIRGKILKVRANGSDLYLGAPVTFTGETANNPDVDLCAAGEQPDGVIIDADPSSTYHGDLDKDSDDPYADNTLLLMYIPIAGDEIYMTVKTNTALTVYTRVQVEAGYLILFAYTDGTQLTDTLESVIGKTLTAVTAVASTETIALIRWSGVG